MEEVKEKAGHVREGPTTFGIERNEIRTHGYWLVLWVSRSFPNSLLQYKEEEDRSNTTNYVLGLIRTVGKSSVDRLIFNGWIDFFFFFQKKKKKKRYTKKKVMRKTNKGDPLSCMKIN